MKTSPKPRSLVAPLALAATALLFAPGAHAYLPFGYGYSGTDCAGEGEELYSLGDAGGYASFRLINPWSGRIGAC